MFRSDELYREINYMIENLSQDLLVQALVSNLSIILLENEAAYSGQLW